MVDQRLNDFIDHNTYLTKEEENILGGAVKKIIDSIFKREKDPIKRRLLIHTIDQNAAFRATIYASIKTWRWLSECRKDKEVKK